MIIGISNILDRLGVFFADKIGNALEYFIGLWELFSSTANSIFRDRTKGGSSLLKIIVNQTYFTGVQAMSLVSIMALMIGVIVTIQSFTLLASVGFENLFGDIMVLGVIRELGPLITTFIVICRTGSGLATYIGNMKVDEEIDALEVMGVNPVRYLIMPAFLGCMISIFCLTLIFDGIAVLGGFVVSQIFGVDISIGTFMEQIYNALSPIDFIVIIFKCMIFGSIIAIVSCYHALKVGISVTEVPQKTINAIVHSIVFSTIFNLLMSTFLYVFFK
ncbi:MAG: ABC transporter permease [Elusimicrobiota bacterium]